MSRVSLSYGVRNMRTTEDLQWSETHYIHVGWWLDFCRIGVRPDVHVRNYEGMVFGDAYEGRFSIAAEGFVGSWNTNSWRASVWGLHVSRI